jgi:hypothetical protein
MKTPHTITARGRHVRVTLKTGETFEDRFVERTRKRVLVFGSGRRVAVGDVKSFSDRRLLQPLSRMRKVS